MKPQHALDPTSHAISQDSGLNWTDPGPWRVAEGVHRIPLPLPLDGLKAVNVYAIEATEGVVLVDGGWAVVQAREELERALGVLGHTRQDVVKCLVTHIHRDHYTLGGELQRLYGTELHLGEHERSSLESIRGGVELRLERFNRLFREAGSSEKLLDAWLSAHSSGLDHAVWPIPDAWLTDDQIIDAGGRRLQVVHTPGHTPGHVVFRDDDRRLMFAGDHVLPTITPSVGLSLPPAMSPLGDFLASLLKVRALPDSTLLPAHGPVVDSVHARVDDLLVHHEDRLSLSEERIRASEVTAFDVASAIPWTRRERAFGDLSPVDAGMALIETKAHLDVLVARGRAVSRRVDGEIRYAATDPTTGRASNNEDRCVREVRSRRDC